MKKISSIFILMFVASLFFTPTFAYAQTDVQPTSSPGEAVVGATQSALLQGENVYSFRDLGYSDQIMNGPYDYMRYRFSLPNTWALNNATTVQLNIKNIMTSTNPISESALVAATGATLDISFNSKWVTTLVLDWSGERIVTIPIPSDVLSTTTGQYTLSIYLDAGIDCEFEHQTTVVISADSTMDLQHDQINPIVDLTQFPRPIYQQNSLIQKTDSTSTTGLTPVVIVTPENPSVGELQSALTISAGFAHLSGGDLPVSISTASALTDEILGSSNLVFVGKGPGFETLSAVSLPAAYSGTKFNVPDAQPEDGVIQAAVSPWNSMNIVMVISGEADEGLIKAAQAVSTGTIQVGNRKDLAIVSEISPEDIIQSVPVDRTLADLGYASTQMGGMKYNLVDYLDVLFYVPAGQTIDGEGYIDVVFTNSAMLNMEQSGLSVLLNGQIIGGVEYSRESSENVTTQRITIPDFLLLPGMNQITIEANNHPLTYCSDLMYANAWTTVFDQTLIHLPLTPATEEAAGYTTLGNISGILTSSPNLESVSFVIAPNSPAAIDAAAKIAYQMGVDMNGDMVEFTAWYADQVPEDYRQDHDLILVGKPSELPLITELGEKLPAPFESGSNIAQESIFRVIYRLPEDTSIGYLELVDTPWSSGRTILAVLGTTDTGILDSANALSTSELSSKLGGDFAVVRGEQILTSDSRLGIGTGNISATLVPDATPEVLATTVPANPSSAAIPLSYQTGWILPVVGILTGLIVIIILVVLITSRKNR
jgi:hypothetical protein